MKLIVIGAGPAGEAAARAAAARGTRVVLVEREEAGGLCLNHGCIPSKSLLAPAKMIDDARRSPLLAGTVRLEEGSLRTDFWKKMQEHKSAVVSELRAGLESTLRRAGVEVMKAEAAFVSRDTLRVRLGGAEKIEPFDRCIIAAGSRPFFPAPLDRHEPEMLDSRRALGMPSAPAQIVIVGGGAVGCEFACLLNALGTEVVIVEKTASLLPGEEEQAVKVLERSFAARGIKILTGKTVTDARRSGSGWSLVLSDGNGLAAEQVLVCVGRRADVDALALEKAGVRASRSGIEVDRQTLQTSNPNIYAVGDATGLSLLAHSGAAQGETAAANALGGSRKYDGALVPRCLYTWPELASAGLSKKEAEEKGLKVKGQRYFFKGSGKALAMGETEGFIQILSEAESEKVLGCQIVGAHATELIHTAALAMRQGLARADLSGMIFAHPTLSEGIRLALER